MAGGGALASAREGRKPACSTQANSTADTGELHAANVFAHVASVAIRRPIFRKPTVSDSIQQLESRSSQVPIVGLPEM
jgi:hypothetical protein